VYIDNGKIKTSIAAIHDRTFGSCAHCLEGAGYGQASKDLQELAMYCMVLLSEVERLCKKASEPDNLPADDRKIKAIEAVRCPKCNQLFGIWKDQLEEEIECTRCKSKFRHKEKESKCSACWMR